MTSVLPPAANGTRILTGRDGQASAAWARLIGTWRKPIASAMAASRGAVRFAVMLILALMTSASCGTKHSKSIGNVRVDHACIER